MDDLNQHNNAKLTYSYTESYVRTIEGGIERTSQKLTTTLGSSAVLLKFSADLPDNNPTLLLAKISSCLFLIITIGLCLYGLKPKNSGKVILPKELLNPEWYYEEEQKYRLYIIRQWIEAGEELDGIYEGKAKFLRYAYYTLLSAGISFTVNTIIDSLFV